MTATQAACIAIVGAESTGKTTLARQLAAALQEAPGAPRVAWVPEVLREWCDAEGRTPRAHEQAGLIVAQQQRIRAAAAGHDFVVCDTTGLMIAVYSRLIFGDRSLESAAVQQHADLAALTLLTAPDIAWQADGHQRDGPHVREPVDATLRELLAGHGVGFGVIYGEGPQRLQHALAAVVARFPALGAGAARPAGLLTRHLGAAADAAAADLPAAPRRWVCDCCVPQAERALQAAPRY